MKHIMIIIFMTATLISCSGKNNSTIMGIGGATVCGGTAYGLLKGRNDNTAPLTILSALVCGMTFANLGERIDLYNEKLLQQTMSEVPDGKQMSWDIPEVPDSKISIVPTNTFQDTQKETLCREYDFHILHKDNASSGRGLTCYNKDLQKWESVGTPSLSEM